MFCTTKKFSNSNRISMLVYGESGSGKTTLTSTLEGKTLIVNAENGLLSLSKYDIDVYDITVDKDGNKLSRSLRFKKLMHFLDKVLPTLQGYQNIVFDSLTEISQNLLENLKERGDIDGFKMWGEYNDEMTSLIKTLRDLPNLNVVLLALDTIDKDEMGRRFTGIDVNGKIAHRIPALLDEVLFLKIVVDDQGKKQRKLLTSPTPSLIAKDRSGRLDESENAHLGHVVKKILGVKNV